MPAAVAAWAAAAAAPVPAAARPPPALAAPAGDPLLRRRLSSLGPPLLRPGLAGHCLAAGAEPDLRPRSDRAVASPLTSLALIFSKSQIFSQHMLLFPMP